MRTVKNVHQITKRLTTGAWNNIELRGQRARKKKYEKPGKVIYLDPALFNKPEGKTTDEQEL
jgi:uncharacterized protein Veg